MAETEGATTSTAHESPESRGRLADGAAAARTEELYASYGRTVSGLCGALLRNRAEAEDAAQQTFLSAHRALLNGTDPREPAAWLATIARNECWGRIRTRMREPLPTDQIDAASTAPDPLAEAIRQADLAALWRAIESLPLRQRDALLLREFGGLSYDELATALAVSGPAVESLLFRARHRLRAQLRTAYASLTGASWLEAIARVFAGGSAPVAAKVAALGVGAAAVSGGAVVAPQVFENHHPRLPAPAHSAPARPKPHRTQQVAAPVVVPVAAPVQAHAAVPSSDEHRGGESAAAQESAGAGETRSPEDHGGGETPAQPASGLISVSSREDGGGSHSGSGGGDSGSGGDGSSASGDGGNSSDGGD